MLDKLQEDMIKEIRAQFVKMGFLSSNNKGQKVCICLSGGVDSTLIGLVGSHIGLNVVALSYHREGLEEGHDLIQSKKTCKIMGWEHHIVQLPKTDNPSSIFLEMIEKYKCKLKTEVEVLYPFIYLFEKCKELGFDKMMTGFCSTPDNRQNSISIRNNPKKYWEPFVKTEIRNNPKIISKASVKVYDIGMEHFGVRVVSPLLGRKYNTIFYDRALSIKDLNTPYQKSFMKKCFPDEFEKLGMMKTKNLNLQKGGQIEDFFSPIVFDDEINFKEYKTDDIGKCLLSLVKYHSNNSPEKRERDKRSFFKHRKHFKKRYSVIYEKQEKERDERLRRITRTYDDNYKKGKEKRIKWSSYKIDDVYKSSSRKLFTVVSTFAGGGGSSTGYRLAGGKVLLINEFVPEAVKTYSENFPDTPIDNRDIRDITRSGKGQEGVFEWLKEYKIKEFDILDGSPPCSTFSVAGKGETKNDAKNVQYSDVTQSRIGYLIHEWVYIANCVQPKVCVLENVPTISSSPVFENAMSRLRRNYFVTWKNCLSSKFGVPQDRKRLIVIAVRNDIAKKLGFKDEVIDGKELFPNVSSEKPTVRMALEGLEPDEDEVELLLDSCKKSSAYEIVLSLPLNPPNNFRLSNKDERFSDYYFNTNRAPWDEPVDTLTQTGQQLGSMGGIYHPNEHRKFTIDELKRLTGLPDDFKLTGTFNQRAERMGRMVPPLMMKYIAESIYEKVLSKVR